MEEKEILEGTKTDNLDATSASPETETEQVEEKVELNSTPVPTPEQVEDANIQVPPEDVASDDSGANAEDKPIESDQPVAEQVESENVDQPQVKEENGVIDMPIPKTFTQEDVDGISGKVRAETRDRTFKYVYDRYGVKDEAELDELVGKSQRFDSLKEQYDADNKTWKESGAARDKELADLQGQVALMQSGIDSSRYEDAKLILRGKGLEITAENIKNELATHPEWQKGGALGQEPNPNFVKTGNPQDLNPEPESKISVFGNEPKPVTSVDPEEEQAMKMFNV